MARCECAPADRCRGGGYYTMPCQVVSLMPCHPLLSIMPCQSVTQRPVGCFRRCPLMTPDDAVLSAGCP